MFSNRWMKLRTLSEKRSRRNLLSSIDSRLFSQPKSLDIGRYNPRIETLEPRVLLAGDTLVISELMAVNSSTIADEDGEFEDWLEIHNPTATSFDLDGWHLTDDPDDRDRWTFPSVTIGAGEYLLVFASGKDRIGEELHTNFRLSGGGEYLALVQPDESVIEYEYTPEFPNQTEDVSFGLAADLETLGFFTIPSPGTANATEPINDPGNRIVINEIMYHPASHLDFEEYIELYNAGEVSVDLAGWKFSNGVDFTFPQVIIDPGDYLVVAASVDEFQDNYPNITNVIGSWTGRLSNSGEQVELEDADGNRIDRVEYADEGEWSVRERGPVDRGFEGWIWSDAHDGGGKSLELINHRASNRRGQNWSASQADGGSPGEVNSVANDDIAPIVLDVIHNPAIPRASDPVTVTARVVDELTTGIMVAARYRVDGAATFQTLSMVDDGLHGDGVAGDRVYGAVLPAQSDGTIVEFYVEASDTANNIRTWPAPSQPSGQQLTNLLYQVDDTPPDTNLPVYRLIMTEQERQELEDIYNFSFRNNSQMNATYITSIGGEVEVRYNTGLRLRGDSSRRFNPPPYRVNIPSDTPWQGVTSLNLNSVNPVSQVGSAVIFAMAGLPASNGAAVEVLTNGVDRAGGSFYAHIEALSGELAENHFPLDSDGNVYKGRRAGETNPIPPGGIPTGAGLQYQGTDQNRYVSYVKVTNANLSDWSDVVGLTFALNQTTDEEYVEEVSKVVNIDEWLRHIALVSLIDNNERGLPNGDPTGDDYAMYRGIEDPRFQLLPHDLDTSFVSTTRDLFRAAEVPALRRFLEHPQIAPRFFWQFVDLMDTVLSPEVISSVLQEMLGDATNPAAISQITNFLQNRSNVVRSRISQELTVTTNLPLVGGLPRSDARAVLLSGQVNSLTTSRLEVDGRPATLNIRNGSWESSVVLGSGINRIPVVAYGINDEVVERTHIDVWRDTNATRDVSGQIRTDTIWDNQGDPYRVTGDIAVSAGATLTIEPGATIFFEPNTRLLVQGLLLAEGTEAEPIFMTRTPGNGTWNGIQFQNTMEENRLTHTVLEYGQTTDGMVGVDRSRLVIDGATFANTRLRRIRVNFPSLIVKNSLFTDMVGPGEAPTDNLSEHIWGTGIASGGEFVIDSNTFGKVPGHNDAIDYDGARLPGPIPQILNNHFLGGGDDALDLEADALIEGNIFENFHKDNFNIDPGESNVISAGTGGNYTVVRNIFHDVDHASLIKEGSFMTFVNNTVDTVDTSALYFDLAGQTDGPGRGAFVSGSIFNNVRLAFDVVAPTTEFTVHQSIIPEEWLGFGSGNISANPRFVDSLNEDFRLKPISPAIDTGPNGLDMGAHVPSGASISGEPRPTTHLSEATLTIGGPDVLAYQFRINDGEYGDIFPVDQPIELTGLADGEYTVYVIGQNSAGVWQERNSESVSRKWIVDSTFSELRINEVLASNVSAVDHQGTRPDVIELFNHSSSAIDISGMSISDSMNNPLKFVFPEGTIIGSDEYLVLYADVDLETPGLHLGFSLDAEGEGVFLFDVPGEGGLLIDEVTFGLQIPDFSIGRNDRGMWELTQPTFGSENIRQVTGDADGLTINEFLASSDILLDRDFIEIYNPDQFPVAVGGFSLTDNPYGYPNKHQITPLSFLEADSFSVFFADSRPGQGSNHVDFRLSNLQEFIGLFDDKQEAIDIVFFGQQQFDTSRGRDPDGSSVFDNISPPTPGLSNEGIGLDPFSLLENLRITELMYHPSEGSGVEYIELQNIGTAPLDLAGVEFTEGISFTFPEMTLAPEEFAVVVQDLEMFRTRYGDEPLVAGQYDGSLSNGGENIKLTLPAPFTAPIHDFVYDDLWYPETDGLGFSMVIVDAESDITAWNQKEGWFPSNFIDGSPGNKGVGLEPGIVTINEILSNSSGPLGDGIEIHNTTEFPFNISGWFLSDSSDDLSKFGIPDDTIIPPGGFVVFTEVEHFGNPDHPGANTPFALSELGGELRLSSANAAGSATGFREQAIFGPSDLDISFGRFENSTGQVELVAMSQTTLGDANSEPVVGPLVINEFMYHPPDGGDEYIELLNISDTPLMLFDTENPQNTWQFSEGIDYALPANQIIMPGEFLLVVSIDPEEFRTKYNLGVEARIVGPYQVPVDNELSDLGETLTLSKPGEEQPDGTVSQIVVDHVRYDDQAPWPVKPAGQGFSLSRISSIEYGNEVLNWQTSKTGGTPGAINVGIDSTAPSTVSELVGTVQSISQVELNWTVAEDPESGVALYRVYRNGDLLAETPQPVYIDTSVTALLPQDYTVSAVNGDAIEGDQSEPFSITIMGLLGVKSLQDDQVVLTFSEPIEQASAEDISNYALDNGAILSASLSADGTVVTLTTSTLTEGETNLLTINNIVSVDDGQWPPDTQAAFIFTPGPPSFTVRSVKPADSFPANLREAEELLSLPEDSENIESQEIKLRDTINLKDDDGQPSNGRFGQDVLFPNNTTGNDDGFVVQATTTVTIPNRADGPWTFGVSLSNDGGNSLDAARLRINGTQVIDADTGHNPRDLFGTVNLDAGTHTLELIFLETQGSAELELFAAPGTYTTFSQTNLWKLVGDLANGGLAVLTEPLPPKAIRWEALSPDGSLALGYQDSDTFEITGTAYQSHLLGGQTVSVNLVPKATDVLMGISISNVSGELASVTASEPGESVSLQNITIQNDGDYIIRISGDASADYDISAALNASIEEETLPPLLSQFANEVLDFSSQFGSPQWSAEQVLGPPNTTVYGDLTTAWAPQAVNGTEEFIVVGFEEPVLANGVTIRETWGNGFVTQVDSVNSRGGFDTLWNDTDTSLPGSPVDFHISWPQTSSPVQALRITINTDHNLNTFEEIDSITLHGIRPVDATLQTVSNNTLAEAVDIESSRKDLFGESDRLAVVGTTEAGTGDFYQFVLAGGQPASMIAATSDRADIFIELFSDSGERIAAGTNSSRDGSSFISRFIPTDSGSYFINVSGDADTAYTLAVTRGADIDQGSNNDLEMSQDISGSTSLLGSVKKGTFIDSIVSDPVPTQLSLDLIDSEGFRWDIQFDGNINDGTSDAYDGGIRHNNFNAEFGNAEIEDNGREVIVHQQNFGNFVDITRKIYVPEDQAYARFLEIISNPGTSTVNYTIPIFTNLGSDGGNQLVTTSSGDAAFTVEDNWVVTDDNDNGGDPTTSHVVAGPGGDLRPVNVQASNNNDNVSYSYDLTLQPGETKIVMHFATQSANREQSAIKSALLESLELNALSGMSQEELSQVVNFSVQAEDLDSYSFQVNAGDTLSITTETPRIGTQPFAVILQNPSQEVDADGPIGYWRFEETSGTTANDSGKLARGPNGTYEGPTLGVAGIYPGSLAARFDGTDDYVSLRNPAILRLTDQITLEAWVQVEEIDGIRNILAKGPATDDPAENYLRIINGQYQVGSASSNDIFASTAIPPEDVGTGKWTHLVGLYNGVRWELYRDGELVDTSPNTIQGAVDVLERWAIGSDGLGTERFFQGSIDEAAIYDFPLSPARIKEHFLYNPLVTSGTNSLDPRIELFDTTGESVALDNSNAGDRRNAHLEHVALLSGQYTVQVLSEAGEGDYQLLLQGATGDDTAPSIVETSPALDEAVNRESFPESYTVIWSEGIDLTTLQPDDFQINGLPAVGLEVVDGSTIEFTLDPATNIGDGEYQVTIFADQITDLQGITGQEFSSKFTLDGTPPKIVNALFNGQPLPRDITFPEGSFTIELTFDEELVDLPQFPPISLFNRHDSSSVFQSFLNYDPATGILLIEYPELEEGDYFFILDPRNNAFEDIVGNDLDGEALGRNSGGIPTGDGIPGGSYNVNFYIDTIGRDLDDQWQRIEPLGSLISRAHSESNVTFDNDTDEFDFNLSAGETVSLISTPVGSEGILTLELLSPQGEILSSQVASGRGEPVAIQTFAVPSSGRYRAEVTGDTGLQDFTLDLVRNAAEELQDSHARATLSIDGSQASAGINRWAVIGNAQPQPVLTNLWAVKPETGRIVIYDPVSGRELSGFDAPDALAPEHTQVGLTIAENGQSLLYVNSDIDPTTIYRLDPQTGNVLSLETVTGSDYDGLGFLGDRPLETLYSVNMDTDPGWTLEGDWEYGAIDPSMINPNVFAPQNAFSGQNIVGTVINDQYSPNITSRQYATTPAIDVTGFRDITLSFRRWLFTPHGANIEVSNDDRNWIEIFDSPLVNPFTLDQAWTGVSYDLPASIDDQSTLFIRWGFGPTNNDFGQTFTGWNIDDVMIEGRPAFEQNLFLSQDGVEVVRQEGLSGPVTSDWATGIPNNALGGDDTGRVFGLFSDGAIHEFDPNSDTDSFLSTLPAPASDIEGLAFDGTHLYASTSQGVLYTLDPDNGDIINVLQISTEGLYGLAVAPATADSSSSGVDVSEFEPNDTFATAQNIDSFFSLQDNPNIGDNFSNTSTTIPHATIQGTGDDSLDFFSFTVETAGSRGIFDVDFGFEGGFNNTYIQLFDSEEQFLNASSFGDPSQGAGGSTQFGDAYMEHVFQAPGVYTISFGDCCPSPVPQGNTYELQISIENHETFSIEPISLVKRAAAWNYLNNGSDQGTAWIEPGYDDSAWSFGRSRLGFGNNGEVTRIDGGNVGNRHPTAYFRREFNVTDPSRFRQLIMTMSRDDGAAVYLNGIEIVRDNLVPNATFDTFAINNITGADEQTFFPFLIDPGLLVEGTNILAAEIHQSSANNNDLGFELTLTGLRGEFRNPDIDAYTIDLTGHAGRTVDILLSGAGDESFALADLNLLDIDGETILATATTSTLGPRTKNYDKGILDFSVPSDGIYTLLVDSPIDGEYSIVVSESAIYDTEPNDITNSTLRSLDETRSALGFLSSDDDLSDTYELNLEAGQTVIISTATDVVANSDSSLDPAIIVYGRSGASRPPAASDNNSAPDGVNAEITFTAPMTSNYKIVVLAESGVGEYHLQVQSDKQPVDETVTGVLVNSTEWSDEFYSYLDTSGLGHQELEKLGYAIPTGDEQLTTLPWSNLNQVSIVFGDDMDVNQQDLILSGVAHGSYSIVDFQYDSVTHVATWTLGSPIAADKLLLQLSPALSDVEGNLLDGEWRDGINSFPSGDGIPGGEFRFSLNVLPGDATRDEILDLRDVQALREAIISDNGDLLYSESLDFDGNSTVDIRDLQHLRDGMLNTLPDGDVPAVPFDFARLDELAASGELLDQDLLKEDWEAAVDELLVDLED